MNRLMRYPTPTEPPSPGSVLMRHMGEDRWRQVHVMSVIETSHDWFANVRTEYDLRSRMVPSGQLGTLAPNHPVTEIRRRMAARTVEAMGDFPHLRRAIEHAQVDAKIHDIIHHPHRAVFAELEQALIQNDSSKAFMEDSRALR